MFSLKNKLVIYCLLFLSCSIGIDKEPPEVSIIKPVDGSLVSGNVNITIEAKDNKSIEKVELFIDNKLKVSLTSEPYIHFWKTNTIPDSSIHSIFAKAYDEAGNMGISETISVMVYNGGGGIIGWTRLVGCNRISSVKETKDNGFIITGEISDDFSYDVVLIKTDSAGNTIFWKTFGGTWGYDIGKDVLEIDDGYIILGSTNTYGIGNQDVYLIKTDKNGNEQWYKTYGSYSSDDGSSIKQTNDNGFIIVGGTTPATSSHSDIYLIKIDINGNVQWEKTYGGSSSDVGISVQQTNDGGYIIAGSTESFGAGYFDVYLIKTDGSGNIEWSRTYGDSAYDSGSAVEQTKDGGYIIAGTQSIRIESGWCDVYLIKTDASGNVEWEKKYGGSLDDYGYALCSTKDGGYVIAGYTESFGSGYSDVYLIKTDGNGNEQWHKTYGGYSYDYGYSVQQTKDGGFIVGGLTKSFSISGSIGYLIKTDTKGDTLK